MKDDFETNDEDFSEEDLDEQDARIAAILGEVYAEVNEATLAKYRDYLEHRLKKPCLVTGIEDFDWEEKYVFGFGDEREYEKLKKKWPSYTDVFEFLEFDDDWNDRDGLFVNVRRVSDKKTFSLPLAELEATDKKSDNYQILHDFSVWFVNSR